MTESWKAGEIEQWPTDRLLPYARNARTHSDAQIEQIAASIREFGFTNPILAGSDGVIIAGHGRLMAAKKLGMAEVPVVVLDHLTDAQRRAYVIADNQLALNAGWDMEMLSSEVKGLAEWDFDLSLLGFADLDALLTDKTEGLTDPDAAPQPPAEPVTVPGDVWLLGKHRIVCGDSTDALVVEKALNGVEPHLMVTDPPYGVDTMLAGATRRCPQRTTRGAGKTAPVGQPARSRTTTGATGQKPGRCSTATLPMCGTPGTWRTRWPTAL